MRSGVKDEIIDDEESIWGFVHEKIVVEQKYSNVSERLWEEYITLNRKSWKPEELDEVYYSVLTKDLHNSFLDDEKILALFKALRLKFDESMIHIFQNRTCAKLKVRYDILTDFRLAGNAPPPQRPLSQPAQRQVSPPPTQLKVSQPAQPKPPLPQPQRRDPPHRQNSPSPLPQRQDLPKQKESSHKAIQSKNYEITPDIDNEMWNFVQRYFGQVPNNEFSLQSFWVKFALSKNLPAEQGYDLAKYFRTIFGNIYSMPIDLKMKMGLMKDLKFKMTEEVVKRLFHAYNVEVEIDDEGFIEKWKLRGSKSVEARETKKQKNATERQKDPQTTRRNVQNAQTSNSGNLQTWRPRSRNNEHADNGYEDADAQRVDIPRSSPPRQPIRLRSISPQQNQLHDVGFHERKSDDEEEEDNKADIKPVRRFFTEMDQTDIAKFLHKEIFSGDDGEPVPIHPKGMAIWRKFVNETGSSRTAVNLASHYRKILQNSIYKLPLDRVMILELYKNLQIPVDEETQTKMQKRFKANIRFSEGCVHNWKFVESNKSPPNKRRRMPSSSSSSSSNMVVEQTVGKDKQGRPVAMFNVLGKNKSGIEEKRKKQGNNESEQESVILIPPSSARIREESPMIETESDKKAPLDDLNEEQNGGEEQMEVDNANGGNSVNENGQDNEGWNSLLKEIQNDTSQSSILPVQEEPEAEAEPQPEEVPADLRNDSGVEDEPLDETLSLPMEPAMVEEVRRDIKVENLDVDIDVKPNVEELRAAVNMENAGEADNNIAPQNQVNKTKNKTDDLENREIVDENLDGEALNATLDDTQAETQNAPNMSEPQFNDNMKVQGRAILLESQDVPLPEAVQLHFNTEIEDILESAKVYSRGNSNDFVTMLHNMRGFFQERVKTLCRLE